MLNILFIAVVLVFGIDLSGVVDNLSKSIGKGMHPKVAYNGGLIPKPFSCSLCSTFGAGLIYLLVTGTFTWFMLAYVAVLSFMTPVIGNILIYIKDLVIYIIDKLYKLIS